MLYGTTVDGDTNDGGSLLCLKFRTNGSIYTNL